MPSIANTIAALTPPQSTGDQLTIALLQSYARQLAELETKIAQTRSDVMRASFEDERQCMRRVAEAVAAVALAYRGGNRD